MDRKVFMVKGWLGVVLSLILCLALVFSVVASAAAEEAEEGCDSCLTYPIMRPDMETLWEWIEAYNDAPRAYIEPEGFEVPSPRGSLSLLDHLDYNPVQRNQGSCGNCWAWSGTGCLGIALDVQEGIKNRLSVQYINSCEYDVIGKTCCTGGWLSNVADFYDPITGYDPLTDGVGQCIPWSNTNAHWQDGDASCDTACGSISTTPNYPITSINEATITTQTVGQTTSIANIKYQLDNNKAVWFGFFLPNNSAWSDFQNFWDNNGEDVVYAMDQFCGIAYDDSPGEGGGHAVLCVGYNDDNPANEYWIMLNSWGTGPTSNRPSGLFRIDMDMDYSCSYPGAGYAFYWQTLDVTFGDMGGDPDITVDPTSFEVTLPPDTTDDYTLTIGNDGAADLTYDITDEDKGGPTAPAGSGELLLEPASMVLEVPLEGSPVELEETEDFGSGWQNIMTDDFEGTFPGAWNVFANSGPDAYWGKDGSCSHSPSNSAFCAKEGTAGVDPPDDYPNDMQAWMIYGPFSLADAADAELNFYLWLDSENTYDYLKWMASIDGSYFYGWGLSGDSGGWESRSFDLTDVYTLGDLCGESEVWIAFIFDSDENTTDKGAFIDDVVLRKDVTDGGNNPPNTPSNPSPADYATGVSVDADLSWTGGDPDVGDTVSYDVYLDTTDATTQVSDDQSATTYDPGTLNDGTKCYWKIVATDNHAASTSGPVWDFTTGGADCAWLSESPTSGSVAPAGSDEITVSIDTTGLAAGDYSADIVIDNNDPDENPKTVPVTLHVTGGAAAPTVTTNAATSVEETTATLNGAISNDGGEACQYRFEYDTDSGEPYANHTDWAGSKTTGEPFSEGISSLGKGTKYYFIAQAKNSGGTGSGSELSFLTKPDAPTGFTATTAGTTQIDLSWTKGEGAQKTKIQRKEGSYPADRNEGTQVYFDTGTSTPDTGLSPGTTYYYRAWSEVSGSQQWSDDYAQDSATTTGGEQPDITVDPTSFEVTLPPDTSQGYTLTIGNDGEATLTYTISDRETTGGGGSALPAASVPGGTNPDKLPAHQEEHAPTQIFEQGDTLEELRDKIEQNGYNFTVDHNWVYDMSPEEKEKFFSRHDSGLPEAIDASKDIGPLAGHLGKRLLPSQFDWRNYDGHSYIGDIGNQGVCGSCYAFGACAAAEGTYNFANGLYDGNCSDFSESFIIWCLGSLPGYNPHFYGCDGSDYDYMELTALTVEGVCSEADFPYKTSPDCGDHWDDPRITFDSWHRIPCGDIDAIKTAIMTYGVVDVAVLTTTAFEAYESGIYEDTNTTCDGEPCYYTPTDHIVALVGWDDNGDPETNGYWILRNSWGTDWGESGYMRIKYRSAVVACEACYLVYGGGGDCAWLSESPTSGTVAPAGSDEITVTIDTSGLADGDYSAEIVIDNNDPDENPKTVPVTLHVGSFLPGDANGDGELNAVDITTVEMIVGGVLPPTPGADANEDGEYNAVDITTTEMLVGGVL